MENRRVSDKHRYRVEDGRMTALETARLESVKPGSQFGGSQRQDQPALPLAYKLCTVLEAEGVVPRGKLGRGALERDML